MLISEPESDLLDTKDRGRKWLFDFNARKIQLALPGQLNNFETIYMKLDWSVIEENHLLRC